MANNSLKMKKEIGEIRREAAHERKRKQNDWKKEKNIKKNREKR